MKEKINKKLKNLAIKIVDYLTHKFNLHQDYKQRLKYAPFTSLEIDEPVFVPFTMASKAGLHLLKDQVELAIENYDETTAHFTKHPFEEEELQVWLYTEKVVKSES